MGCLESVRTAALSRSPPWPALNVLSYQQPASDQNERLHIVPAEAA